MISKKHPIQKRNWRNRIHKGALYTAIAGVLSIYGCGDSSNETAYETVVEQQVTKGVITTLKEAETGKFEIIDEQVVESPDASRIIVQYLAGRTDTMTVEQAKGLISPETMAKNDWSSEDEKVAGDTTKHTTTHVHHRSSMSNVLWFSAMGYMMGRSTNSPVYSGFYNQQYRTRRDNYSGGGSSAGSGFRTNASEQIRSTTQARTVTRPVSGKSGFFGGGGSSRGSGGFGG